MVIFSDGFESGNFKAWNLNFNASVVSSVKHSGIYSMKVASGVAGNCKKEITATNLAFVRFFILITGQPAEDETATLIMFGNAALGLSYLAYRDVSGITQFYLNCGGDTDTVNATLLADVWHCIEMEYNDTTDIHRVWIDGTLKLQTSHDFASDTDWFRLGVVTGNISQDVYIDDALYDNSYPGATLKVTRIRVL
jgi:hypothetical protein